VRTAIQGGWVIAWQKEQHFLLDGGIVIYNGSTIEFVGFPGDPECPRPDRIINASGKLISPGFVNFHCIANFDLQILNIDHPRSAGYNRPSWVIEPNAKTIMSDDDFRISADFSVTSLLKCGNTSFGAVTTGLTKFWDDADAEPYALAEASERLGARAWLSHLYQEACDYMDEDGVPQRIWDSSRAQTGLDKALSFIKYANESGSERLNGFLFPYQTARCSDELLKETMRQSELLGNIHVRSHFSQRLEEFKQHKVKTDESMVEWLQGIGFLGRQVSLVHAKYIAGHSATGDEPRNDLQILAETETTVCHTPIVYARSGDFLESFSRYARSGVNMALGCDTFPPDLLEEIRAGSLINKIIERDRMAGMVKEFFYAATIGGAKALGRDDIGKLEAGCKADISVFNIAAFDVGPIDDPMRTLLHFANGQHCETVIVDGNVVVENGLVNGVDEEALRQDAQRVWTKYKAGIVSWDYAKRRSDEIWPPLFPIKKSAFKN
jgi:cytosine/adenosine deaminase-related metal-dependent hydrolase